MLPAITSRLPWQADLCDNCYISCQDKIEQDSIAIRRIRISEIAALPPSPLRIDNRMSSNNRPATASSTRTGGTRPPGALLGDCFCDHALDHHLHQTVSASPKRRPISAAISASQRADGLGLLRFPLSCAVRDPGGWAGDWIPTQDFDACRRDGRCSRRPRVGRGIWSRSGSRGSSSAPERPDVFESDQGFHHLAAQRRAGESPGNHVDERRWGGAFTPLLVVWVFSFLSWRDAFVLFGAIGMVWAIFFFRWFRDDPRDHPA